MEFSDLASHRHALQDFCDLHRPSLRLFQSGPSFKLTIGEPDLGVELRHITTTATCIESLLECPHSPHGDGPESPRAMAERFAKAALGRPHNKWKSEGSATIYCRCRALPLAIRYLDGDDARVTEHVQRILAQLTYGKGRFGIGEADARLKRSKYPPNAYHTFWTLEILQEFERNCPVQYRELDGKLKLGRLKDGMILWAGNNLGFQVSLHAADSSVLDSDQLAWSLAVFLKFTEGYLTDLGEQDLVREALKGLFKTQLKTGSWRHYRSLFHYREAGNAYCYVYETFAVLLRIALIEEKRGAGGAYLREWLRPHLDELVSLWRYADSTKIPLSEDERAFGWCSGHQTNVREAEGWATASVFAFGQALRRLVGIWTREAAIRGLPVTRPPVAANKAPENLVERGETWCEDRQSVARQLSTMFINPILKSRSQSGTEPDAQPISNEQARSAILFGPPGTSKTFLCGCVAAAVGWQYIEVHASHFVAAGLPEVQKTADEIFNRLMELDHAVILFDEIDELVREREMEHDAFGRFLTTSMLPKLAKLWHQRKVMYFVATNHIQYFDSAITRPQRFDALILVGTPSYDAKVRNVQRITGQSGRPNDFWRARFRP